MERMRVAPLVLLRMLIGWHFLYEGWSKITDPSWTSAGYLKGSTGPLAGLFLAIGGNANVVAVTDFLNMFGLTAIGLALMLGVAIRPAAWGGVALLSLYYLAYPPLFSPFGSVGAEGAYLLVNKNLVELFALAAIATIPAGHEGLGQWWRNRQIRVAAPKLTGAASADAGRRALIANLAGLPVLGGFVLAVLRKHGWKSFEEANLAPNRLAAKGDTFTASATVKRFQFATIADLKGEIPKAAIGRMPVSRLIMGGNLIGGWAHARDLIYVSKLVKAYHHRDKIFQTLALAESCGVNSIITNPALCGILEDYWRHGGKIQFISDCGNKDLLGAIRKSIDHGASACYIQGALADDLVAAGKFDTMAEALDLIRAARMPAGIGGHKLVTITESVKHGLKPDFWMKTLHRVNYWSAQPGEKECDNIWCEDPDATVAYMKSLDQPWIAFKVMAAGALEPRAAFKYAFESGADFVCAGMYDFQIVEDANIALDVLNGPLIRERMWRT